MYTHTHTHKENMIYKGLDDEESVFLTFVADRKAEHEDELIKEEIEEVSAYRVRSTLAPCWPCTQVLYRRH